MSIAVACGVAEDALTWTAFGPLSISAFALTGYDSHTDIWAI